jgi:hypothetical protein
MNYLPGLASNLDPPDLCLLSSYRCEPLASCDCIFFFFYMSDSHCHLRLSSRVHFSDTSSPVLNP